MTAFRNSKMKSIEEINHGNLMGDLIDTLKVSLHASRRGLFQKWRTSSIDEVLDESKKIGAQLVQPLDLNGFE